MDSFISNDDQPKKKCQYFCSLVFQLIFGVLCIVFSTVPSLYGSKEECEKLRIMTFYGGILFITTLLIHDFVFCCSESEGAKNAVDSLKALSDLAVLITIWVFLAKDEDCGALRTFIWVYTWIIVGSIGISLIILIWYVCHSSKKKIDEEIQHEQVESIMQTNEQKQKYEE